MEYISKSLRVPANLIIYMYARSLKILLHHPTTPPLKKTQKCFSPKHVPLYHSSLQIPMYRAFALWYMFTKHVPYLYHSWWSVKCTPKLDMKCEMYGTCWSNMYHSLSPLFIEGWGLLWYKGTCFCKVFPHGVTLNNVKPRIQLIRKKIQLIRKRISCIRSATTAVLQLY